MFSLSRFSVARLAMLTTLLGVSVLGSACVQDQDLLIVEHAVWFSDRDNCALSGAEDTPLAMAVDVKFDTQIAMAFLVTNNQVTYKGSNTGIDDTEVEIQTADVSLSFSGGAVSGSTFEVQLPTDAISGGDSENFLIRIPSSVTESLRATMEGLPSTTVETLEMEVVFHGRRTGQVGKSKLGSVKTRPYTYPFDICYGCLETCVLGDSCMSGMDTCPTETEWEGACGFAQGVSIVHPDCEPP
jgi:hypothetical protein